MRVLVVWIGLVAATASAGVFRVGTWNLARGINGGVLRMGIAPVVPRCMPMPDNDASPAADQCKALLANGWPLCANSSAPDVLLLHDVDRNRAETACANQAEMMRSAVGMTKAYYVPRDSLWEPFCPPPGMGSNGIAVMSGPRATQQKIKVFALPQGNGCCPVNMIASFHEFEGKKIGVYSTHLSHSSLTYPNRGPARKGQVDAAMKIISSDAPSEGVDLVIFGGDLNAPATEPEFDSLRNEGFVNAMIDPLPIAQIWFKVLRPITWFSFAPDVANACAVSDHDYRIVSFAIFPDLIGTPIPLPTWWYSSGGSAPYPLIRGSSRVGESPTFERYRWCSDEKAPAESCYPFWCDPELRNCG